MDMYEGFGSVWWAGLAETGHIVRSVISKQHACLLDAAVHILHSRSFKDSPCLYIPCFLSALESGHSAGYLIVLVVKV